MVVEDSPRRRPRRQRAVRAGVAFEAANFYAAALTAAEQAAIDGAPERGLDDEVTLLRVLVRRAVAAMRAGAAGGGCAVRFDGQLPLYARLMAAVAMPVYFALGLASGCFLFCTRKAFDAAGGFDEGLFGGEEAVMSRALGRQGRFVVLREHVTTSGRKLRAYSAREILGLLGWLALTGPKSVRRREGLEIWYGERRADPTGPTGEAPADS